MGGLKAIIQLKLRLISDEMLQRSASPAQALQLLFIAPYMYFLSHFVRDALHWQSLRCPGAAELLSCPGCVGREAGYFVDKQVSLFQG